MTYKTDLQSIRDNIDNENYNTAITEINTLITNIQNESNNEILINRKIQFDSLVEKLQHVLIHLDSFIINKSPHQIKRVDRGLNADSIPETQTNLSTVSFPLTTQESRTIIPIQMQLPDSTWSNLIEFNFDNGASWATDVPLELLSGFGSGQNGVPSNKRVEQPSRIRIMGLVGEYDIPVMIQDKEHYDLFRAQPPPERYPAVRLYDIIKSGISFIFTNTCTKVIIGLPLERNAVNKITLPDMISRPNTPTGAWQWMMVRFHNPKDPSKTIDDWFGLNTGDHRMIVKKSLADSIELFLTPGRNIENFDTSCDYELIESTPIITLNNIPTEARDDNARFGRGGVPRNIGGQREILNKYSMIFWFEDSRIQRCLVPTN